MSEIVANSPRQIIVTIPESLLLQLITGQVTVTNLPDTARVVSGWFDTIPVGGQQTRLLKLRLEDESFPPITPGLRIPRRKLQAQRTA
jgi:hypothetical protein